MSERTRQGVLRDAMAIQSRMNRLIDEAFGGLEVGRASPWDETWRPQVDLVETADAYVFRVELPGLTREDVEIEADPRTVVFRGEKRRTREVDQQHVHRMECAWGRFERRFALGVDVEPEAVEASLREGVLMVRVPKVRAQSTRRIEIRD